MANKQGFWTHFGWRVEAIAYDLFVGFMRMLPIDAASDLGGQFLGFLGPITSTHKTVQRNLRLAFPEMTEEVREALARQQWVNTGRTFAEFSLVDRISADPERMIVEGREHLEAIAKSGRPVVFFSLHQSNWELITPAIQSVGLRFMITYRAANNPYVDRRIIEDRKRFGVELYGAKGSDGARELLLKLQDGTSVGLMNDQKFNRGVPGVFFGHPVETAPGPTRLAQRFGTVLQPITVERLYKARFKVTIHEAISVAQTGNKTDDITATVANVNAFVEAQVRAHPEEWFWSHKRWPDAVYAELKRHEK